MNALAPKSFAATGNILTWYIRHPVWFLWQRMEQEGSEELVGGVLEKEEKEEKRGLGDMGCNEPAVGSIFST